MDTPLHISRATRLLEAFLLPPICCLCGLRALGGGLDLCGVCAGSLPLLETPEAFAHRFDRVLIPYAYAYPIDHFVRALKFRGERRYARLLGTLLAHAYVRSPPEAASRAHRFAPLVLVPMPLHIGRLRQRGFNQAYELARFAGALLQIPVLNGTLIRIRSTSQQSRLDTRHRHLNVLGVFEVVRPLAAHVRIALVDDVVTTGSTAVEAAYALRTAGAQHVELWAAARALTRRDRPPTTKSLLPALPSQHSHAGRPASGGSRPGGFPE